MAENVKDKDGNDIEIVIDENGKPVARPIDYKKKYEDVLHLWNEAQNIMNQSDADGGPWATRAAQALKFLGLSTGKPVRIPKLTLYSEYTSRLAALNRKATAEDKQKIYEDMAKHFHAQSAESIRQQLKAPAAADLKARRMVFGKNH
ncbi:MAG TPA: hypothetical protein PLR10_01455 [Smithella sp.]|nr:hypothetical protein [Smithella sp.]HQG65254.1 hypothetical protein [Smithella sp.]